MATERLLELSDEFGDRFRVAAGTEGRLWLLAVDEEGCSAPIALFSRAAGERLAEALEGWRTGNLVMTAEDATSLPAPTP